MLQQVVVVEVCMHATTGGSGGSMYVTTGGSGGSKYACYNRWLW